MQGLHESSSDALRIVQITTVLVIVLLGWAFITLLERGGHLPPPPTLPNLAFSGDALGWLKDTAWPNITPIAILVGFGHSFLAMSGEESLAQVYREIESPRIVNLRRTGAVIFMYSLVLTGSVSFLAAALTADDVRSKCYDNLISGIVMHLVGLPGLWLAFQAFVVLAGDLSPGARERATDLVARKIDRDRRSNLPAP